MTRLFILFLMLFGVIFPSQASIDEAWNKLERGQTEALEFFINRTNQGDGEAAHRLGTAYAWGDGVARDTKKGLAFLNQAIQLGNIGAYNTLAGIYLHGKGVKKDPHYATRLYEVAANLGHGPGQFNCGIMHMKGDGIPKDPKTAYYYLSLASLNRKDLGDLTQNAAHYRDYISKGLTPAQRQEVLAKIARTTARIP